MSARGLRRLAGFQKRDVQSMTDKSETSDQPIETAPKDGRWIEVLTIPRDINERSPMWHRVRWWPEGTSWVGGDLVQTGVWTDDDGWLQPDEVSHWREVNQ